MDKLLYGRTETVLIPCLFNCGAFRPNLVFCQLGQQYDPLESVIVTI